ncbi:MAG: hypothetical protein WBB32_15830 [Flavobacteriales bacterium]
MNRTIGIASLISGIFFGLCGLLHLGSAHLAELSDVFDLNTVLFLGGGFALFVGGILLLQDVQVSPPGSLMVRRK